MSLISDAIWAASPTTTRGQPTPLSSDPKGERIAYASGKSVFLRSIDDPAVSKQYTQHTTQTTVARFSPSGFYVASGDVSGTVKVWDCAGEGATKGDYHIIAGRINDIAWDGDSQRIIAVGDGKERFGHCITADSGNSVGEIAGHSSQINCVSIRQQRPLRAVTGSDDTSLVFYHGAPFKFNTSLRGQHNRFVYGSAFAPDGSVFASVGADKRIWLYDGKTGEAKGQIGDGVHTGSIFGISWSKDSNKFVTASADQTVRIWDPEAGKAIQTWRMGEEGVVSVPDQQVGVVWPTGRSDGLIVSVDLEGNLNYLVDGNPKPTRVVRGHQKNITSASISGSTFATGSYEGRVLAWDVSTGLADKIEGAAHSNYVAGITATESKGEAELYSVGWDDTLRSISISSKIFTGEASELKFQPKGIAATSGVVLVASSESIAVYSNGVQKNSLSVKYAPTAIAAYGSTVAVGGDDKLVHIYTLSGTDLKDTETVLRRATSPISAVAFSSSGDKIAFGTSNGKIYAFEVADWKLITDRWSAHTARITCLAWDASGKYAASGSLDTNVMVWSTEDPGKRIKALNAHKDGVSGVAWEKAGKVISAGGDASIKVWIVKD
ncbi:tricorn protease domain 2-containing protein [Dothidotthia symphoricarpi CBS 119687]|uniref:Tricorn protease domain 2-containing protein n=1 Tax=Dothidotthia symphoricarpi CBS 119687 TaxID=1392245 RepID=A0A6A6ATD6_9PLEO|nr:tricorn protease domain 2-containing protein [Dothidotthia symphoricarpi CBS 119687]KAF2134448.1 tricorn protease domain 2-containing protein [Dothidotthia symphoricarpi CBS 119687]